MIAFLVDNFVPIMFCSLIVILLTGFPVAFGLAATGLIFGVLGIALDLFPTNLFQILPLRIFGIMQNETMLAIPFFTLMGIILERSGMAEDLLETMGQLFGTLNGGLAISVILVGALLAASTGVTSAVVISMGLISLPVMLRYGYNREIAAGVITASGAMVQALPPSLVLIVMADQLGRSVGDMYAAAIRPGLLLIVIYVVFIMAVAFFRPHKVPALPEHARIKCTAKGNTGRRSLGMLVLLCTLIGLLWAGLHNEVMAQVFSRPAKAPTDQVAITALIVASLSALSFACINRITGWGLLSQLAERFVFALIPPVILIFLVLGTIFMGIATPTEGGAMGAIGAMVLAMIRKRLTWSLLNQALENTAKLAVFVMFILIGSTVFSFTFSAADGHLWVEKLFDAIPGGELGFIIAVCAIIFVLGMFLDFFEIAFIVVPLLIPVANSLGVDLIWFGIVIALVLQTSFLTPPFGFALLYLRSVAPKKDYTDPVSKQLVPGVRTEQIWKGSAYFVVLQLVVVAAVVMYPQLVTGGMSKSAVLSDEEIMQQLDGRGANQLLDGPVDELQNPFERDSVSSNDPMAALMNSL
ncbi:TRAP transporter large permease subunit [Paenalcaligenes niemegkensis]|uniref:TRAP transporter large permease n=1 Tax=Paenalcaligenes niemegkensis TaxID=2895469 RepID=UPI001EE81002|nr:TRAP transporter large permease subunit [Paenalcaligenes niemegkensis]MCQ9617453.1 TRAP transporter large permease subunit [Paenalcaligenes niemegkensis]